MHRAILFFCVCLLASDTAAAGEYYTFTDEQGRSIKAKPLRMHGDKVEIEREDGLKFRVDPGIFITKDQEYLARWRKDRALQQGALEIKALSATTRKQEEDTGAIVYKHFHGYYEIEVENTSDLDYKNLVAEYRYFVFHNDLAAEKPSSGKLERVAGKHTIHSLPARTKIEFATEQTKMKESELKPGFVYSSGGKDKSKDELEGVWVRLYKGEAMIGEFAYPSNLPEKEDW